MILTWMHALSKVAAAGVLSSLRAEGCVVSRLLYSSFLSIFAQMPTENFHLSIIIFPPPLSPPLLINFHPCARSISRDVFVNLPSMKNLYLNENNINTLHDKAFKHLTSLKELDLSNNQIKVITADSFHGLTSLISLNLRGNLIAMIGDRTFIEMPSLTELELDQNEIKYITEKALDGMRNLKQLTLSENELVTLEPDFLAGAPAVYMLNLRDNKLKTMTFDNIKPIVTNLYNTTSHFYLSGE